VELFILRMTPYRERDYIITSLSSEGLVTFKAVGLAKPTAKLAGVVTLYAIIDAELEEKKTGLIITNAVPISKNYKILSDYQKLSVLQFFGETSLRLLQDPQEIRFCYPFIRKAVLEIEGTFSPLTLAYIVLAKILQAAGYGLEVNKCVYCQIRNDIVGINYIQGGFVCRNDLGHDYDTALSPDKLNIIRYAFLVNVEQMTKVAFENSILLELMDALIIYYQDSASTKLKSFSILRQSFN